MSFANRIQAITTMTAACVAHAEKNGWNLTMHIAGAKYYWQQETWWMEMVRFIMQYPMDTTEIQQWGLFDKLDIGIIEVSPLALFMPSSNTDLFKQYIINYLRTERLRS